MARPLRIELIVDDNGTATVRQFGRNAERELGGISRSANTATSSIKSMGVALGGVAAIWGAVHIGKDIIKVGSDFEKTMAQVKGVSRATENEFIALKDQAKLMGETTVWSATQSAEALVLFINGWF